MTTNFYILRVIIFSIFLLLDNIVSSLTCPGLIIDSNCGDNQASEWNSENIGLNLKEWVKSVKVVSSINNLEKLQSPIRYRMLKASNNDLLLHLSSFNCKTNQTLGPIWQISGTKGDLGKNGFNDGFFYVMADTRGNVSLKSPLI